MAKPEEEKRIETPKIIKRLPRPKEEKNNKKKEHIIIVAALILVISILFFPNLISVSVLETDSLQFNYQVSDENVLTNLEYYGFLDTGGSWYIMKYNITNESFRYVKGRANYLNNWNNKTNLAYRIYNEVFP